MEFVSTGISLFGGRFSCRCSGWLRHQGAYFRQTSGESPPAFSPP
jgi:hypothetical protein